MGTLPFAHPTGLLNLTGWRCDGHAALCPSYGAAAISSAGGMAVSPGPGRAAAAEWVKGWVADESDQNFV
jgi:hypothetical protein